MFDVSIVKRKRDEKKKHIIFVEKEKKKKMMIKKNIVVHTKFVHFEAQEWSVERRSNENILWTSVLKHHAQEQFNEHRKRRLFALFSYFLSRKMHFTCKPINKRNEFFSLFAVLMRFTFKASVSAVEIKWIWTTPTIAILTTLQPSDTLWNVYKNIIDIHHQYEKFSNVLKFNRKLCRGEMFNGKIDEYTMCGRSR